MPTAEAGRRLASDGKNEKIGVERMAARQIALVRGTPLFDDRAAGAAKPVPFETLGCATVICTDKTGTLTRGIMTVRELWGGSALREPPRFDLVEVRCKRVELSKICVCVTRIGTQRIGATASTHARQMPARTEPSSMKSRKVRAPHGSDAEFSRSA